jgi:hypothetical protein
VNGTVTTLEPTAEMLRQRAIRALVDAAPPLSDAARDLIARHLGSTLTSTAQRITLLAS